MTINNTNSTTDRFNSRESYLAWVKEWKSNYRQISEQIRDLKREISTQQKDGAYTGSEQRTRQYLRHRATSMLKDRIAMKVEAQRQYLAAREASEKADA